VLSVLDKIIHLTSRQTGTDITKVARWLRCLFNLTLTCDEKTSLKCTEEAIALATRRHGVSPYSLHYTVQSIIKPSQDCVVARTSALHTPPPSSDPAKAENENTVDVDSADDEIKDVDRYPPTELEWLATTAFNHSVDYYLQENDEMCRKWANQAFILAQWLEDDGALRTHLMEKFASLGLGK
jgi:hypothetical protein